MNFISYLQAAKRDCRMFMGLKSTAKRLERLEMKLAKHNPAPIFGMTNRLSRATIIPALYETTNRPNFKPRSAEQQHSGFAYSTISTPQSGSVGT